MIYTLDVEVADESALLTEYKNTNKNKYLLFHAEAQPLHCAPFFVEGIADPLRVFVADHDEARHADAFQRLEKGRILAGAALSRPHPRWTAARLWALLALLAVIAGVCIALAVAR